MNIDLTGKTILVTGASRGIGEAITRQLAASGASIAVHFNNQEIKAGVLVNAIGKAANAYKANLMEEAEIINLFETVVADYGQIDGLVNNAGIAIPSCIDKSDTAWLQDWSATIMVNLNAAALLCKKAITHFLTKKGGRIVNITSRAAFRGDTADYMAYAASKGGLVSLTRSLARAYGKSGIKVFNIAPGFVRTDMAQSFIDQYGEAIALDDLALNELTEPDDIAPMVAMLLSGLADHATGSTIDINAGSYVH